LDFGAAGFPAGGVAAGNGRAARFNATKMHVSLNTIAFICLH
jgi:hypothetical protein